MITSACKNMYSSIKDTGQYTDWQEHYEIGMTMSYHSSDPRWSRVCQAYGRHKSCTLWTDSPKNKEEKKIFKKKCTKEHLQYCGAIDSTIIHTMIYICTSIISSAYIFSNCIQPQNYIKQMLDGNWIWGSNKQKKNAVF